MTYTVSRAKALAAMILGAVLIAASLVFASPAAAEEKPAANPINKDITVMSFNLWYGSQVGPTGKPQHLDAAKIIEEAGADVVFFQETVTYRGEPAVGAAKPIADILGWNVFSPRDVEFYPGSASLISKYPIIESELLLDDKEHNRWAKAVLKVGDDEVTVYSAHLEYEDYAVYFPRGYAGHANGPDWPEEYKDWKPLPDGPVTDTKVLNKINEESGRPESARRIVEDANAEAAKGRFVIFGGDFNEASALDWTEETKDMFQRNGVAHKWETTQTFIDAGFIDTYREIHPDPAKAPGTSWPVPHGNSNIPVSMSAWMKAADERDRIDFIFYKPTPRISLKSAQLVGPKATVKKNQAVVEETEDTIFTPETTWFSDHRATMATFSILPQPAGVIDIVESEDGSTTVKLADGRVINIPAEKNVTGMETTDTEVIVKLSDGSEVRLPKGPKGDKGEDGKSITIVGTKEDADGTVIEFSNGETVTIKAPQISAPQNDGSSDNGVAGTVFGVLSLLISIAALIGSVGIALGAIQLPQF